MNQNCTEVEDKMKNNQRMIVQLMTDNIYNLRYDHPGNEKEKKKMERDELLKGMINARNKRMRVM